uniref:Uncharacterized protein n=1 Tax=Arundo donax TaxID=35708 RepID=A0A0A8ZQ89_ARUDO
MNISVRATEPGPDQNRRMNKCLGRADIKLLKAPITVSQKEETMATICQPCVLI